LRTRGGCFCNPGASEAAFAFQPTLTARCLAALGDSFTIERFAACLGRAQAVGAVRASIGTATSIDDVERLVDLAASFSDA
jgi:phosphoserine aminotransferase